MSTVAASDGYAEDGQDGTDEEAPAFSNGSTSDGRRQWATRGRYSIVPDSLAVTNTVKAAIETLNASPAGHDRAGCSASTVLNVWSRYCGWADSTGNCWPKQREVAAVAALSEGQVRRAVRVLTVAGLMTARPVFRLFPDGVGWRRVGTRYQLHAPRNVRRTADMSDRATLRAGDGQESRPSSKPKGKTTAPMRDIGAERSRASISIDPPLFSTAAADETSKAAGTEQLTSAAAAPPKPGTWGNNPAYRAFWDARDRAFNAGLVTDWPTKGMAAGIANAATSSAGNAAKAYAAELVDQYAADPDEYAGRWDDAAADALSLEPNEYAEASGRNFPPARRGGTSRPTRPAGPAAIDVEPWVVPPASGPSLPGGHLCPSTLLPSTFLPSTTPDTALDELFLSALSGTLATRLRAHRAGEEGATAS
jgi:hypothetical protein